MTFSHKILIWYAENKRTLPWRRTKNPYKIWLSEIMLQQTRVVQGTPYYLKFVEHFPTVYDLADADEEYVLKLWQGLGYYSRARNLHATAKTVVNTYNGKFPNTYKELLMLKGVGDYTASAIASICFNEAQPVVDGNVYRVLARYYGISTPINSKEGIRYFKEMATKVMDADNIRDYNQGIMEFGAIQCRPKKPNCSNCPLNDSCIALKNNSVTNLPLKIKKTKVRNRYFNYLVFIDGKNRTRLQQRTGKGIWQGLWQFPLLESKKELALEQVKEQVSTVVTLSESLEVVQHTQKIIIHKLSHQHLYTRFWIIKTHEVLEDTILFNDLENYPVPVLIADFISAFKNSYF